MECAYGFQRADPALVTTSEDCDLAFLPQLIVELLAGEGLDALFDGFNVQWGQGEPSWWSV
ncbi:hypothetical protein CCICO_08370 [Corynebacterium ciconiae DSM 44920]|uniref:hypothetical protein n=1 Tax=Corynebacterium ciconiae TaxID=227319 RepID=UPI0003A4318E|nr:hypothetical protein [Corynebacterium ciconiae]WKD61689.1 hypothetical protein CCICO_08370 [Corynebacterium ciconiae DSM 44920]